MTKRNQMLLNIHTDEGIVGHGEVWTNYPAWNADEKYILLKRGFEELLVGQNPLDIEGIISKINSSIINSGTGRQWGAYGHIMQAVSGIDIALWDIKGKFENKPLYKLISPTGDKVRDIVPAYASGLDPRDFDAYIGNVIDMGYKTFKLKVGFSEEIDLANCAKLTGLIGPDKRLFIDANQGWSDAGEALSMLDRLKDFGPELIEEPVASYQIKDYIKIKEAGLMKVAGGENLYGVREFVSPLEQNSLDLVQPDITKTGGVSELLKIIELAKTHGIGYAPHMFSTGIGLMASLQIMFAIEGGTIMEVDGNPNPFLTEILSERFVKFSDGDFTIDETNELPGIGFVLDQDFIDRYRREPKI
jgi:L-alanine-DL-glutamate epimerase-like enolase superfamily enzyme